MAPPSSLRWIKHFVGKCGGEQAHLRQQVRRFEHSGERLHITKRVRGPSSKNGSAEATETSPS